MSESFPPIILVVTESADKCLLLSTTRIDTRLLWKFDIIENPAELVKYGIWDEESLTPPFPIEHLRESGGRRRPKIIGGKVWNTGRIMIFPDGSFFREYMFSNPNNTLPEQYLKVATGCDQEMKWHFDISIPILVPPEELPALGPVISHETHETHEPHQRHEPQQTHQPPTGFIPVHIFRSFVESAIQRREECPVSKDIITKENAALTPCGHLFTNEGLRNAIQYNSKCPTCRAPLSTVSIQRW